MKFYALSKSLVLASLFKDVKFGKAWTPVEEDDDEFDSDKQNIA